MNTNEIQAQAAVLKQFVPIEQSGNGFYTEEDIIWAVKVLDKKMQEHSAYQKRKNCGRKKIELGSVVRSETKFHFNIEMKKVDKRCWKIFEHNTKTNNTRELNEIYKSRKAADEGFDLCVKNVGNGFRFASEGWK